MAQPVTDNIIVKGTPDEIFQIWSSFQIFPHFMSNIKSVQMIGPGRSHWVMEGPLGKTFEWDAETTRMEPNKRIAWNSINTEEGGLKTSGQVTFNELPDGQTEVSVTMVYDPPGGALGEAVAALFAKPEERVHEDLKNFKNFVESRRYTTVI